MAPVFYRCKIPAQQYFRNFQTFINLGSGVDGWREQVVLKAVHQGRLFIVQHTREQADDRICQHTCSKLAAGKHKVADGYFLCYMQVSHPLVYSFVMSAEEYQIFGKRKTIGRLLVKRFPIGGEID